MNNQTNYVIDIPENYWETTTTSGEVMLEYEEMAQLKMAIQKQDALILHLEKIRAIAINALEAIDDSGKASIAELAIEEIRNISKFPNG